MRALRLSGTALGCIGDKALIERQTSGHRVFAYFSELAFNFLDLERDSDQRRVDGTTEMLCTQIECGLALVSSVSAGVLNLQCVNLSKPIDADNPSAIWRNLAEQDTRVS
jgi:hypothetical protein